MGVGVCLQGEELEIEVPEVKLGDRFPDRDTNIGVVDAHGCYSIDGIIYLFCYQRWKNLL